MGLDLTIYKENKKGKRQMVAEFSNDGWPIVTYLEKTLCQGLNDKELYVSIDNIYNMFDACKQVLIEYYNRTFEKPNSWVDTAKYMFSTYKEEYNDTYIDNISYIYKELWNIQEELNDNEKLIFEISY